MDLLGLLAHGELTVEGRLMIASNVTLLGEVTHGDRRVRCVYKPVAGERPLWDFPDGTLANREVAAYLVSEAAGWHVVPPTVLRADGPAGAGMCQAWLEQPPEDGGWVDVVAPDRVPAGALPILEGAGADGEPVVLVHADDPALRRLALFDAVANNADRKGGHVLVADPAATNLAATNLAAGEQMAPVVGVDHGVSFHEDPKLRTVLWGWAGLPLTDAERSELRGLRGALDDGLRTRLADLLSEPELAALDARIAGLLEAGELPRPAGRMPVPWPVF